MRIAADLVKVVGRDTGPDLRLSSARIVAAMAQLRASRLIASGF